MAVEAGDIAPDFELKDNHGRTVRLSDFQGPDGGNVVLVFYPYAFSGTCTGEMRALRDRMPAFADASAQLLVCSTDSFYTLRVYGEQEGLEFPLLADFWPHGEVARAYGVFDEERGCATRGTFVMDKQGVVRWSVVNPLTEARDTDDYLKALRAL